MKVAAAATESPAICAGFIVRGGSAAAAGCTVGCVPVGEGEEVRETESAMTVSVGEGWDEGVLEVIVGLGLVVTTGREDSIVEEPVEVLGDTVTAVRVGVTALLCPRQTLYAAAAPMSEEQDAYMHPRATSPSDFPSKL